LALLEEELRSDLRRDEMDGRRLASFFRLKGMEDCSLLALVMRLTPAARPAAAASQTQVRRFADFCERFLVTAGWHVLSESRDDELRCIAAIPSQLEVADAMAALKLVLDRLTSDALSVMGLAVLVGACPSRGAEGDTLFLTARDALALARPDRPVVLLAAGRTGSDDGVAGIDRRGSATVERALAYMHAHLAENLSLADVAQAVGSAPSHLSRLFGRYGSDTFVHVLCRLRIAAAKSLLRTGQYRVKEVCAMVGFNDQAYFSRVFRKYEGLSPVDFRTGDD
jgi:AraC-like DNA-binding protein